jgi:hypothetical protein
MRLASIIVVGLLCSACAPRPHADTPPPAKHAQPTLAPFDENAAYCSAYTDFDLRTLPSNEQSRLALRLDTLFQPASPSVDLFQLWWIRGLKGEHQRWLVIDVHPPMIHRDAWAVRARCLNADWQPISTHIFPCGYRFDIVGADIDRNNPLQMDLLCITTTTAGRFMDDPELKRPAAEVSYEQREFFAIGESPLLVRFEDNRGSIIANSYGLEFPNRSTAEWQAALDSSDIAAQLAALAWLTGEHLSSSGGAARQRQPGTVENSTVYEEVLSSPRTAAIVSKLADSPNAWVREYAQVAARKMETPPLRD